MGTGLLDQIVTDAPVFLLIAVRALALIETAPLLSTDSVPQAAKVALAGFAAYAAFPFGTVQAGVISAFGLGYAFLVIGEAIIGIIMGFYMLIIFSAFSTAGQIFSLPMGFGMLEVFDPMTQAENPLMSQYLNLVAMLVFLSMNGLGELFLGGFWRSLQSISVVQLAQGREAIIGMFLSGLSRLFVDAVMISLPIMGTLFITSLATGLISKVLPQSNILSEGFPISITVAFLLIMATMPFMIETFGRVIDAGFQTIQSLYTRIGGGI